MQVEALNTEYLGRAIASLRTARGMKRMDLKRASGLSYPYISEIENGSKKSPSLKAVAAIAAALGVSPAELQARAEEIQAADSGPGTGVELASADPETDHALQAGLHLAARAGQPEDELAERITARVLAAIAPQVRELVVREVRFAIREELLQQRETHP